MGSTPGIVVIVLANCSRVVGLGSCSSLLGSSGVEDDESCPHCDLALLTTLVAEFCSDESMSLDLSAKVEPPAGDRLTAFPPPENPLLVLLVPVLD